MAEPRPSRLRRLLREHPDARGRLARAVGSLMGAAIVGLAAIGLLLIWHLARRGRLIREGLSNPRAVRLPEVDPGAAGDDPPRSFSS